ncbi:MAG: SAM-dependent methyltransferase [Bacteroidales bacterium]|nr:SAM-dependent methyltransferase [Bacteroidales bacterium]
MEKALNELMEAVKLAIDENKFVKLTLSKPRSKQSDLKNMYVKMILLKGNNWMSFTYKHNTKDIVKNFAVEDAAQQIIELLETSFFAANLLTSEMDYALLSNEKGSSKLIKRPVEKRAIPEREHDHTKSRLINPANVWWFQLGITDRQGNVLPSMQFKFKQINKYVEILDGLIKQIDFHGTVKVVDMGAGKAYLTFALYEYLVVNRKLDVQITGVEQRPDLVEKTNNIAKSAKLENLRFVEGMIGNFAVKEMDVLIALHACDTATDDAIAAGINAGAKLIVCAPCCHKQIRQIMKPPFDALPMLKFGILLERQAEILTDTIRALIMEKHGYKSQIMEFIETEHTPKNLLITGIRTTKNIDIEEIDGKIASLKKQFGIEKHYLETLLS